jgi:DNA adenine methylase
MKAPQPIPYQGSKRILAPFIINYFPANINRLIEPFAGSAAVSIAAAMKNKAEYFIINDINSSLVNLLKEIVDEPRTISDAYEQLWNEQLGNEKEFFLEIRKRYNESKRSDYFLYVLARCVKGAIRYNANGEFNQSADNRRKGRRPQGMKKEIELVSQYLKERVQFHAEDYSLILKLANHNDLVYMDPPYQGTCKNKDPRYFKGIDFEYFVSELDELNSRSVPYIISYDGMTGEKVHGRDLPSSLNLHKILIEVGRSSQSTLLGKNHITFESLYLSDSLIKKLTGKLPEHVSLRSKQLQLSL